MNERGKDRRAGEAGGAPERRPAVPREIGSEELLGNCGSVHIRHGCEVYTLRRTSNGKLILTK
jgi:hemin uptake protein HemP